MAIGSVCTLAGVLWSLYEKVSAQINAQAQALHITPLQVCEQGLMKTLLVFTPPPPDGAAPKPPTVPCRRRPSCSSAWRR